MAPSNVLFACTLNAVRSPMAAALMRHLAGERIYVESAGVRAGALDLLHKGGSSEDLIQRVREHLVANALVSIS